MSDTNELSIVRLLIALSHDCENTDGWEDAAPDVSGAAATIAALYEALDRILALDISLGGHIRAEALAALKQARGEA